jgi:hypothetical protein
MINHARTLLLNDGEAKPDTPGEELIAANFSALPWDSTMLEARRLLFGNNADRIALNFRLRQFMELLHATELRQFITDLDSRITYLDNRDNPFTELPRGLTITSSASATTDFQGDQFEAWYTQEGVSTLSDGKSAREWRVTIQGDGVIRQATVIDLNGLQSGGDLYPTPGPVPDFPFLGSTYAVDLSVPGVLDANGRLTEGLPLPRSSFRFFFKDPGCLSPVPTGDCLIYFKIKESRLPTRDLSEIETELRALGEPKLLELFNIGSPKGSQEPWLTFRRLWETHPEFPYRFGGILLALIYQADALRSSNG